MEMWETLKDLEWDMVLQSIVKESILKDKRRQWQQMLFCRKILLKAKAPMAKETTLQSYTLRQARHNL